MITKDMYRLLKRLPRWPANKNREQIDRIVVIDKFLKLHLIMSGIEKGYIGSNGKEETAGFYLTECGKEAVEEYQRAQKATSRSTCALVISLLSLLVSVVAMTTT